VVQMHASSSTVQDEIVLESPGKSCEGGSGTF
jgi:hypothetical protein